VESDTLRIKEEDAILPPKQSKKVQFDYVPRIVSSEYRRLISIYNKYNPKNTLAVEIRAENNDAHQIILHSIFYKLYVRNTKPQLQVYYDRCLYNVPNVRILSIRNLYYKDLELELSQIDGDEKNDMWVYQLHSKMVFGLSNTKGHAKNLEVSDSVQSKRTKVLIEDLKWGQPDTSNGRDMEKRKILSRTYEDISKDKSSVMVEGSFELYKDDRAGVSAEPSRESARLDGAFLDSASLSNREGQVDPVDDIISNANKRLSLFAESRFPFSSLQSQQDSLGSSSESGDAFKREEIEKIRNLQLFYSEFEHTLEQVSRGEDKSGDDSGASSSSSTRKPMASEISPETAKMLLRLLTSSKERQATIKIPVGKTIDFAVVLKPLSVGSAGTQEERDEELSVHTLLRSLELRLLSVDMRDAADELQKAKQKRGTIGDDQQLIGEDSQLTIGEDVLLKPRSIIVKAKAYRSEMSLMQRNINFGPVSIGDAVTKSVTLTNKSAYPLIYSIAKSGSFASGFVLISSGRKGQIAALESRTIDFVFKPTLPGPMEETLRVENVLEPSNSQSIIIKARVRKPQTFWIISPPSISAPTLKDEDQVSKVETTDTSESKINGNAENLSDKTPKIEIVERRMVEILSSEAEAIQDDDECEGDPTVKSQHLGQANVGGHCSGMLKFIVRNVTSKPRLFVVDAGHAQSLVLWHEVISHSSSTARNGYDEDVGRSSSSDETSGNVGPADESFAKLPFENLSEVCGSICRVRCEFDVKDEFKGDALSSRISLEERKILEDKLEFFQQKHKGAVRKQKPEKIAKYNKKIQEIHDILQGKEVKVGTAEDQSEGPVDDDGVTNNGDVTGARASETDRSDSQTARSEEISSVASTITASSSSSSSIVKKISEQTLSIQLGGDSEAHISVRLFVLPDTNYRHWKGPMPFKGSLRVFESRNEDFVRSVQVNYCHCHYIYCFLSCCISLICLFFACPTAMVTSHLCAATAQSRKF
jgi:hypothetical protein